MTWSFLILSAHHFSPSGTHKSFTYTFSSTKLLYFPFLILFSPALSKQLSLILTLTSCFDQILYISSLSLFHHLALSTRLSLVSPSASPSVSLDNLYLGANDNQVSKLLLDNISNIKATLNLDNQDTLYLGEEAASADAKNSAVIGGLTITEYEGSPRR